MGLKQFLLYGNWVAFGLGCQVWPRVGSLPRRLFFFFFFFLPLGHPSSVEEGSATPGPRRTVLELGSCGRGLTLAGTVPNLLSYRRVLRCRFHPSATCFCPAASFVCLLLWCSWSLSSSPPILVRLASVRLLLQSTDARQGMFTSRGRVESSLCQTFPGCLR